MRLTFGQLEHYGQAERIDQGMYLGDQAAARATHATDRTSFFGVGSVLMDADRAAIDHLNVSRKSH